MKSNVQVSSHSNKQCKEDSMLLLVYGRVD